MASVQRRFECPEQAQGIPWLLSSQGSTPTLWTFTKNDKTTQIQITGRVTINSLITRLEAAKSAQGIIGIPDFVSDEALGKSLVQLLPDYEIEPEIPIYAVYPNSRFLSPRLADFVEHLSIKSRTNSGFPSV
jgi:DNA-binding transcriptional LysR family regulator